ncbi:MAG: hypothetical protein IKJ01_07930, partial [Lachnospiraceae bacterium]|nr:hypothetical protein [Lachnospiraceae bacterium]
FYISERINVIDQTISANAIFPNTTNAIPIINPITQKLLINLISISLYEHSTSSDYPSLIYG